ncbi:MAG: Mov34/MPN/PAD-1 family protein [Methanomassiliicoccales archaeon PtaU1.Bin030]|nr:MAG: Mov34/MPN/PAD-1 family protein [Methanomassiliicoccales archaeon PtaU1.Bin030]
MSHPLIVGRQQADVREAPPPSKDRIKAHKWLTARCQSEYRSQEAKGFELYISKVAEEKMRNHALMHVEERKEVMGLMLGSIFRHAGREYTVVRDVATTDLDATEVSVRFDPNSFEKLFACLDDIGFRYVIVGWYHSHPSYHCYMSSTDVQTQRGMFNLRCHSAVVIDPVNREIEAFYLEEGKVRSRPFAIYWDEYQSPYYGTTVRMRQTAEAPCQGAVTVPR